MKNLKTILIVLTVSVFALTFTSCKSDDDPETQVSVKITDGPFPFNFVTEANVTVDKVELKGINGEFVTVFEGNTSYNMVGLTNGTTADVGVKKMEPGTYATVRITTSNASIQINNGNNIESSESAQVKTVVVNPPLVVEEGNTSELLIDLDLSDSFGFGSVMGTILGWIPNPDFISSCEFHPEFRVCDINQTGEISGTVTANGEGVAFAEVSINANGEIFHTHTEADGTYKFIGVLNGNYTVTVETSDNLSGSNTTEVSAEGSATCDVTIN